MLATLILLVCLKDDPTHCQGLENPEPMPAMECLSMGQAYAHDWFEEHPKWMLKSYACRIGPKGKDA